MIDTYQNLFLSLKVRDLCIWIRAMIYTYLLGIMMSSFLTLEMTMYHYGSNFSGRKCIPYICTIKAIEQTQQKVDCTKDVFIRTRAHCSVPYIFSRFEKHIGMTSSLWTRRTMRSSHILHKLQLSWQMDVAHSIRIYCT